MMHHHHGPGTAEAPGPEEVLVGVVGRALRALTDRSAPHTAGADGELMDVLRAAVGRNRLRLPGQDTAHVEQAAVAVRVACAYLSAGDLPEARLALVAAADLLGDRRPTALPDAVPSPAVRRSPAA